MASYERRRKELKDALPKFLLVQPDLLFDEYTKLNEAIEPYYKARDEALTEMQTLLADTSDNERKSNYDDKLARGRQSLSDTLGRALSTFQKPSKPGLEFQQAAEKAENQFWDGLAKLDLGFRRDVLMWTKQNTKEYIKTLDKGWETITSENRPLHEDSKRAVRECLTIVREAAERTMPAIEKLKKAGAEVTERVAKLPSQIRERTGNLVEPEVIKATLKKLIGDALNIENFDEFWDSVEEGAKVYAAIVQGEYSKRVETVRANAQKIGNVLISFPNLRREADDFVKKSGYSAAELRYAEAKGALEQWAKDLPTEGLQNDAKEIAAAMLECLSKQLKEVDTAFKDLVTKHKGRFVGELGPDIEQILTEKSEWEQAVTTLTATGLEAKLRAWHAEAHNVLQVDLERTFRQFEDALRDQPEELRRETESFVAAFKNNVLSEAKKRVEVLDKEIAMALQLANPDKMLQDFDRKLLTETVRRS